MPKPRVAFLGLGTMGIGMAGRLLDGGIATTVYNRHREKAAALAQRGAVVAASPGGAAADADIVISMVADDHASRAVWLAEAGALPAVRSGTLLIECSTLTVRWVRELAAAARQRGCEFLDAPVTGSKPQAAAGELLFLVGGAAAAVEAARPVLSAMGRGIVHLGPTGSGALVKLVNNFMCGVQAASVAEALAVLEGGEVEVAAAFKVLSEGAPGSPIVRRMIERAGRQDFEPAFSLRLMAKDLRYAVEEAARAGVRLQTASAALAIFEQATREGLGEQDFSAVTQSVKSEHKKT